MAKDRATKLARRLGWQFSHLDGQHHRIYVWTDSNSSRQHSTAIGSARGTGNGKIDDRELLNRVRQAIKACMSGRCRCIFTTEPEERIMPEFTPTERIIKPDANNIGQAIRSLRLAKGWKMLDLSQRAEIPKSTIANWETGRNIPKEPNIRRLSDVFGVDPSVIRNGVVNAGVAILTPPIEDTPTFTGTPTKLAFEVKARIKHMINTTPIGDWRVYVPQMTLTISARPTIDPAVANEITQEMEEWLRQGLTGDNIEIITESDSG